MGDATTKADYKFEFAFFLSFNTLTFEPVILSFTLSCNCAIYNSKTGTRALLHETPLARSNERSLATRSGHVPVTTSTSSSPICKRSREMAVTGRMAAAKAECVCVCCSKREKVVRCQ